MSLAMQYELAQAIDVMKKLQRDFQKLLSTKQILDGQLTENEVVQEELKFLQPENSIFKLTGPLMIVQDLEEAKQNVAKRIDYISGELKRNNDALDVAVKKQEKQREVINKLEEPFKGTHIQSYI